MKINRLIILVSVVIALIVTVVAIIYSTYYNSKVIKTEIANNLEINLRLKANSLESSLDNYKSFVSTLASGNVFRDSLNEDISFPERYASVQRRVIAIEESNPEVKSIRILNENGITLYSDYNGIALDCSQEEIFSRLKEDFSTQDISVCEEIQDIRLVVSSPILIDDKFKGVLIVNFDMKNLDKVLSTSSNLGDFGESYLLNNENYPLTPLLFVKDAVLKKKINIVWNNNCSKFKNGSLDESFVFCGVSSYLNYNNVSVIGARTYFPEMDLYLVSEFKEGEMTFRIKQGLLKNSIYIILTIVFFVFLVGFSISRLLSNPLRELTKDVDEISKGKLDVKLSKSNIYEINRLTESLMRVLASLKLAILRTGVVKAEFGLGEATKAKKEAEGKALKQTEGLEKSVKLAKRREKKMTKLKKEMAKLKGEEYDPLKEKKVILNRLHNSVKKQMGETGEKVAKEPINPKLISPKKKLVKSVKKDKKEKLPLEGVSPKKVSLTKKPINKVNNKFKNK